MKVVYVGKDCLRFEGVCLDYDKTSLDPLRGIEVPSVSRDIITFCKSFKNDFDYDLSWMPNQEKQTDGSVVINYINSYKKYMYPMSYNTFKKIFKPYENFNTTHVKRLTGNNVVAQLNEMFKDSNIRILKTDTLSKELTDVQYTCKVGEW